MRKCVGAARKGHPRSVKLAEESDGLLAAAVEGLAEVEKLLPPREILLRISLCERVTS